MIQDEQAPQLTPSVQHPYGPLAYCCGLVVKCLGAAANRPEAGVNYHGAAASPVRLCEEASQSFERDVVVVVCLLALDHLEKALVGCPPLQL